MLYKVCIYTNDIYGCYTVIRLYTYVLHMCISFSQYPDVFSAPSSAWIRCFRVDARNRLDKIWDAWVMDNHIGRWTHVVRTYVTTYMPTYRHTYVGTYIHTYVHMYLRTYYIRTFDIRNYVQYTYVRTYVRTYVLRYIHTYIHTYIHACVHTYIHT